MQKSLILFVALISGEINAESWFTFLVVASANGIMGQLAEILEQTALGEPGNTPISNFIDSDMNLLSLFLFG